MRLALVIRPFNEANMRLARQIGVTDIVAGMPPEEEVRTRGEFLAILHQRKRVEDAGLTWSVLEGIGFGGEKAALGLPGRDEEIERTAQRIRNLGAAGVPIVQVGLGYGRIGWYRTSVTTRTRGGALVPSFDLALLKNAPPASDVGEVDKEKLWENFAYAYRRILPVAEEAGVKICVHPADPPITPFLGTTRLFTSVEDFKRALELVPSPYLGLTFCQGCFAEMGVDIPETIRYFGQRKRIFFVHFRDVKGTVPKFEETFHDDGKTDMLAAMRAYYEVGFDGPGRPDHVPMMEGEEGHPGYTMMGRLFAIGYMKGLIQAALAMKGLK